MNRTSFKRRLVWTGRDTEPALTVLSADDFRLFSLSDPCPISGNEKIAFVPLLGQGDSTELLSSRFFKGSPFSRLSGALLAHPNATTTSGATPIRNIKKPVSS